MDSRVRHKDQPKTCLATPKRTAAGGTFQKTTDPGIRSANFSSRSILLDHVFLILDHLMTLHAAKSHFEHRVKSIPGGNKLHMYRCNPPNAVLQYERLLIQRSFQVTWKLSSHIHDGVVSCYIHDEYLSHESFELPSKLVDPVESEIFRDFQGDSVSSSDLVVIFIQFVLDIFQKKLLLLG